MFFLLRRQDEDFYYVSGLFVPQWGSAPTLWWYVLTYNPIENASGIHAEIPARIHFYIASVVSSEMSPGIPSVIFAEVLSEIAWKITGGIFEEISGRFSKKNRNRVVFLRSA